MKCPTETLLPAIVLSLASLLVEAAKPTASLESDVNPDDLARMKTAIWLNQDAVARDVGFVNENRTADDNPYPDGPYDVSIQPDANCYVGFRDAERTTYELITATSPPTHGGSGNITTTAPPADGTVDNYGIFLTHQSPCGVCSNLVDLAVYLEQPDLTSPVRLCGIISFINRDISKECLLDKVGFSDLCGAIWLHNTEHTRDKCATLCIILFPAPSNWPLGFINPCQPATNGGMCTNTINRNPVCQGFQYEWGSEFRLNACLQCDECESGPLFQKISGRTRRNSGIVSNIQRPDIPTINHNYFSTPLQLGA